MPLLKQALVQAGVLPTAYAWTNPFKILEYHELVNAADIRSTDVVLDIGCGAGVQDLLLARRAARVVGIDVSPDQIARARARVASYRGADNIDFRCTPLEAAGFGPREFDRIFSFSVFEHIFNRDEVLDVIVEVLKPGGRLVMSVDSLATITDPALIAKHRADHAVLTYFTPADLRRMLESRGLRDVRIWPIFRSLYAKRLFEDGIRSGFQYRRYGKFGALARLVLAERRHADADLGMFLCVTAVRRA